MGGGIFSSDWQENWGGGRGRGSFSLQPGRKMWGGEEWGVVFPSPWQENDVDCV